MYPEPLGNLLSLVHKLSNGELILGAPKYFYFNHRVQKSYKVHYLFLYFMKQRPAYIRGGSRSALYHGIVYQIFTEALLGDRHGVRWRDSKARFWGVHRTHSGSGPAALKLQCFFTSSGCYILSLPGLLPSIWVANCPFFPAPPARIPLSLN